MSKFYDIFEYVSSSIIHKYLRPDCVDLWLYKMYF